MKQTNHTYVTEFVIIGFQAVYNFKIPLFILFLFIYIVTCLEHLLIIGLVSTSTTLQTPMYFILRSMSFCELFYVTNMVPKMLHDILLERPTISIIGCITQLNIFGTMGNSLSLLYALMSYDRFLAIAKPLQYSTIISNRLCLHLVIGFCLLSFIASVIMDIHIGFLKFCGSNIIDHFYCDFTPLIELSCSDTTFVRNASALMSSLLILLALSFNILSYVFIIYIILGIPSATGRQKAFSTCSSHLLVTTMTHGTVIGVYVLPSKTNNPHIHKGLSFMYILVMPLVMPIIYTLRNQEFHRAFGTKVSKLKQFHNL